MGKRNESWIICIIFKYKYGLDCELMNNNAVMGVLLGSV